MDHKQIFKKESGRKLFHNISNIKRDMNFNSQNNYIVKKIIIKVFSLHKVG